MKTGIVHKIEGSGEMIDLDKTLALYGYVAVPKHEAERSRELWKRIQRMIVDHGGMFYSLPGEDGWDAALEWVNERMREQKDAASLYKRNAELRKTLHTVLQHLYRIEEDDLYSAPGELYEQIERALGLLE